MNVVFRTAARVAAVCALCVLALAPTVLADDGDGDDEDAKLFEGDDASDEPSGPPTSQPDTGQADDDEEAVFRDEATDIGFSPDVFEDKLTIGGQLYLRLTGNVVDSGSFGEQRIAMPNLLDLYLDARPVDRVRAYVRGRMSYDPTIASDSTDLFGLPVEPLSVALDQLWLKTDIARTLYITLGKQRVKWGESRLWNPTDFLNNTRRDPLAFFDERTGVNLLRLHFPIESLDWNIYLVGILDGVNQWDRAGGAARMEMTLGPTEWSVSFAAGKNMKTAFGLGVSAPIWDFDVSAELSVTNESGVTKYTGPFAPTTEDLANCLPAVDDPTLIPGCLNPPGRELSGWYPRVSGGLTYAFRYNDGQDLMLLGIEYFYNATGYSNIDPYAWLLLDGGFQPFYLGQHYAGFVWSIPGPGNWDDVTFTTSTLANLSDLSVVTRLDVSMTFFTRLRVEAYVMGHYGTPGGELRFELDVPDGLESLDLGVPLSRIPKPVIDWGINLRLAI